MTTLNWTTIHDITQKMAAQRGWTCTWDTDTIPGIPLPSSSTSAMVAEWIIRRGYDGIPPTSDELTSFVNRPASAYRRDGLRIYVPYVLLRGYRGHKQLRRDLCLDEQIRQSFADLFRSHHLRSTNRVESEDKLKYGTKRRIKDGNLNLAPFSSWSAFMGNKTITVFKYPNPIGLEFECYAPNAVPMHKVQEALPIWCQIGQDGSIRPPSGHYGLEIKALVRREDAELRLYRLCKIMQDLGLRVNKSCGLHVHMDARGINKPVAIKNARIMDAWLCAMQELGPLSRRDNSYCRFGIAAGCRYRAVNIRALESHRTLEVRLGSATLDYTKVIAWIRLLEVVRAVRSKPKPASCLSTLEQLPLPKHDLDFWRARHRQLNPHLYQDATPDTTTDNE